MSTARKNSKTRVNARRKYVLDHLLNKVKDEKIPKKKFQKIQDEIRILKERIALNAPKNARKLEKKKKS